MPLENLPENQKKALDEAIHRQEIMGKLGHDPDADEMMREKEKTLDDIVRAYDHAPNTMGAEELLQKKIDRFTFHKELIRHEMDNLEKREKKLGSIIDTLARNKALWGAIAPSINKKLDRAFELYEVVVRDLEKIKEQELLLIQSAGTHAHELEKIPTADPIQN